MDAKYGCSRTDLDELAHLPVVSLSNLLDGNGLDALPQCLIDLHPHRNMMSAAVICGFVVSQAQCPHFWQHVTEFGLPPSCH